ncbi:MAG: outer membrane protein assembly factor BamB [Proteobacteria bacterium]|nr:outer membrane protein assembly factor BamB [Pseudomonadota bacterium]
MLRNLSFLFTAMLLLGGCSWFSWLPWVDGDDKEKEDLLEPAELTKYDAEVEIKRLWKASIGDGLGKKWMRMDPVVVADRVYAADGYGRVQAQDRFTGKRVWQIDVGEVEGGFLSSMNFIDRRDPSFVSGGVGSGLGAVYVGTTFGTLVALAAADGSEIWRAPVGSEVLSSPTTGEGLVFVQTINGQLLALEGETGAMRWTFDNQVPVLTLRGTSSPVYADGIVYAGFANGKISALRANNGEPIWEQRVQVPEGRSELDRIVDVDGKPLLINRILYAASFQGKASAMRASDGTVLWEKEASTYLDLVEGYGHIYIVDDIDVITAIDQQTAEVIWVQDSLKRRQLSQPVAFSNYLVVGDDDGYLHVLAQSDGRLLGRKKLDGDGLRSRMKVEDSIVFVLGNSGSLQAIDISVK